MNIGKWSGRRDLNPRPLPPQGSALAKLRYGPIYEPSPQQAAGYLRRTIMIHPAEAYDPPSFATANYGEIRPAIHLRCKQRGILAKADKPLTRKLDDTLRK